jgi:hypothetical protein
MTIRVFLSIIAVLGVVHGIAFIVVPEQVAASYGLVASPSSVLTARLFGGALLAWCAILWAARSFRDEGAVRSVLIATCFAEAVSLVVVIAGTLAGTMNAMGWVAVLIYLFGAVGCVYFLAGQKRLAMY